MDLNTKNMNELLNSVSEKIRNNVAGCVQIVSSIKWKKVSFIIPMKPEPSHRPRLCGYRVYVPGAAKNATFFNNHVLPKLRGLFIDTPCKVKLDIYVETPASFTKTQKCLAEMKILRPWGHVGDIDNFEKAVYDARALDTIIENVNDISLLGSAIYSRWRYFNHWAYDAAEILSMPNRSWFIIALNRLAELCKDEQEK